MRKWRKNNMRKTNTKSVATKKTANKAVKGVKKAVKTPTKTTAKKTTTKANKTVKKANKTVEKKVAKKTAKNFDVYEIRKDFLKAYGYNTVSEFAQAIGDDIANTTKVLQGKQNPNIEKMIKYAVFLGAGLGDVINLFYPEAMKYYKENHNKKRK